MSPTTLGNTKSTKSQTPTAGDNMSDKQLCDALIIVADHLGWSILGEAVREAAESGVEIPKQILNHYGMSVVDATQTDQDIVWEDYILVHGDYPEGTLYDDDMEIVRDSYCW